MLHWNVEYGHTDGKGTLCWTGTKHPSLRKWCGSLGCDENGRTLLSHSSSLNSVEGRVPRPSFMHSLSEKMSYKTTSLDENLSFCNPGREFVLHEPSCMLSHTSDAGQSEVLDDANVIYAMEYLQGVSISERITNAESSHKTQQRHEFHVKEVKKKSPVDIFEGHWSHYLMLSLQLGSWYKLNG